MWSQGGTYTQDGPRYQHLTLFTDLIVSFVIWVNSVTNLSIVDHHVQTLLLSTCTRWIPPKTLLATHLHQSRARPPRHPMHYLLPMLRLRSRNTRCPTSSSLLGQLPYITPAIWFVLFMPEWWSCLRTGYLQVLPKTTIHQRLVMVPRRTNPSEPSAPGCWFDQHAKALDQRCG